VLESKVKPDVAPEVLLQRAIIKAKKRSLTARIANAKETPAMTERGVAIERYGDCADETRRPTAIQSAKSESL
jgi:hypothetical protein